MCCWGGGLLGLEGEYRLQIRWFLEEAPSQGRPPFGGMRAPKITRDEGARAQSRCCVFLIMIFSAGVVLFWRSECRRGLWAQVLIERCPPRCGVHTKINYIQYIRTIHTSVYAPGVSRCRRPRQTRSSTDLFLLCWQPRLLAGWRPRRRRRPSVEFLRFSSRSSLKNSRCLCSLSVVVVVVVVVFFSFKAQA